MEAGRRRSALVVALVCLLALAARLFVAVGSIGSNDILTWCRFGDRVLQHGAARTYVIDPWFNHPPLMGWLAAAAYKVTLVTGWRFDVLFKLPSILAGVAAVALVARRSRAGTAALVLFALNPADVLVTGYHGNTDGLCVFVCAVAVALADGGRPLGSGLALAAALNVKLIPVVLVLPLLASFTPRERPRFLAGLSLGLLPFLAPLVMAPGAFLRNAVFYGSFKSNWGLGLFVVAAEARHPWLAAPLWELLRRAGKALVLAPSLALGVLQARRPCFDRWELGALAFTGFLVLAPGFGIQYVVYPIVFLMVASPKRGLAYAYVAGLFAALVYYQHWWKRTVPPVSYFGEPFEPLASLIGFVAWLMLLMYGVHGVTRARAARASP